MTLGMILVLLAFIFALLATIGVPGGRFSLGWASLACYFLSLLVGGIRF